MSKILVAYFSASGVTARAAKEIAQAVDADLYETPPGGALHGRRPELDGQEDRSTREMNDPACRPAIAEPAEHMEQYDTVFVAFPSGGLWNPGSWTLFWRAATFPVRP